MNALINALISAGHTQLVAKIEAIKPSNALEAVLLKAAGDALHRGVTVENIAAQLALLIDADGDDDVAIDFTDIQLGSQLLAAKIHAHKQDRTAAHDFLAKLVDALAPIGAIVGGMVLKSIGGG